MVNSAEFEQEMREALQTQKCRVCRRWPRWTSRRSDIRMARMVDCGSLAVSFDDEAEEAEVGKKGHEVDIVQKLSDTFCCIFGCIFGGIKLQLTKDVKEEFSSSGRPADDEAKLDEDYEPNKQNMLQDVEYDWLFAHEQGAAAYALVDIDWLHDGTLLCYVSMQ